MINTRLGYEVLTFGKVCEHRLSSEIARGQAGQSSYTGSALIGQFREAEIFLRGSGNHGLVIPENFFRWSIETRPNVFAVVEIHEH